MIVDGYCRIIFSFSLFLPPGSLLLLPGRNIFDWHGIVKKVWQLTITKLRPTPVSRKKNLFCERTEPKAIYYYFWLSLSIYHSVICLHIYNYRWIVNRLSRFKMTQTATNGVSVVGVPNGKFIQSPQRAHVCRMSGTYGLINGRMDG